MIPSFSIKTVSGLTNVIFESRNGIGWIRLNRPKAINSLQADMVAEIERRLSEWKTDPHIALIAICGEGEKGFCSGGDMRAMYERRHTDILPYAERFFVTEYIADYSIHTYPKPIVALMNGVVMGGGVGLSIGAQFRIVTDSSKWAMPEMNIGFFPDVGASYFLNRFPGYTGRYLALTSEVIGSADALYVGAADRYVSVERWEAFKSALAAEVWSVDGARERLERLIEQYSGGTPTEGTLAALRSKIDLHFHHDTMENILESLRQASAQGDEWASRTIDTLLSKSPLSLKVTLRLLQLGRSRTLQECLAMEVDLALNFMRNPDFFEGVRSVLVDKDRRPGWQHNALQDVRETEVESYFRTPWANERNPLHDAFDIFGEHHGK